MDMVYEIDYSKGNGSGSGAEDMTDEVALIEADGRSDAATSFNPSEASSGILMSDGSRRSYKQLYDRNEGTYNDDRTMKNREVNLLRDAHSWCNYLDLTKHQTERVLHFLDDRSLNVFGTIDLETAVVALISHIANLDRSNPNADQRPIQWEENYKQLFEDLEIEYSEYTSAKKIVRNELKD